MTHRVLLKLDVMKRYEKKKLSKYDMTECRNLGKVQFNPYLRTPLLLDFKLDYESSRDVKSNISAVPSTNRVIQCNRSPFQQRERPQSGSSAQINRKNYSGKPSVRPLSAPSYLEHKPSDQRGNLQSLDGGFMILKLTPKVKPALWKTTEVQKRGVPEQCFINYLYTGTSSQDRAMTVTAEKGHTTDQSLIYNEGSNQAAQEAPGSESQVKFCINGNLSSDNLKARKDTLLKGYITKKEEETKKSFIHYTDMDLKKKAYVPLCIEDEIEKPDAKVIRAGCPKKSHIPVKMSESFPVLCHNEEYTEKYVLNRWLALYGNKAFYDMNKRGEVCMHLNPVLQNNYDESIAIIGSRKSPPSKITAKKKKPKFSGKPKRITIQILSVEKAPCYVPLSSQKTAPFLQKIHRRITRTVSRHNVVGRHIQQKISESNKDILMIHGVNPQSNNYPHISSSVLVSRVKSQLPIFLEKQFTSVEEIRQKGRMIFVDYIPISKPIPIHPSGEELLSQAPNSAIVGDCTKLRPMEINQSEMYHRNTFEQKQVDERKSGDIDFIAHEHLSSIQKSSERSSRSTSSLSLRGFEAEENNSLGAQKSGTLVKHSEEKHIASTHCPVISIPTAQFETSELHRDQNVQQFNDI